MSLFRQKSVSAETGSPDHRSLRFDFSVSTNAAAGGLFGAEDEGAALKAAGETIQALELRCVAAEDEASRADLERCRVIATANHEIAKRDNALATKARRIADLEDALRSMTIGCTDTAKAFAKSQARDEPKTARPGEDEPQIRRHEHRPALSAPVLRDESAALDRLHAELARKDAVVTRLTDLWEAACTRVIFLQGRLNDLEEIKRLRKHLAPNAATGEDTVDALAVILNADRFVTEGTSQTPTRQRWTMPPAKVA